jgi:adenylate cyclase
MTEGTQRRLAAVLAADVAGYSRLMGEDETGTLSALRHLRTQLFAPTVSDHRGKIIKSMGDGWLVEFASVVDAVTCAIELQQGLAGHESIKLRVGVHLGDITHEDDDIYGDGVNIAARLQEIAEPGAIAISDIARRSIDGKLAAAFANLGAHTLKNISEPVTAYGWGMTSVSAGASALPLPDKPSIAILPFDNLSDDPDQAFFANGIAEDIGTELSRFDEIFVISRNATSSYAGGPLDLKKISTELGVRHVLTGSVRRALSRVRIAAQLVDGSNGSQIWADKFDRNMEDVFEIQDEISAVIVNTLLGKLRHKEFERSLHKRPDMLDAYDLVLRATVLLTNWDREDAETARNAALAAVKIDPNFARAHALLGWAYCLEATLRWVDEINLWFEQGYLSAVRAVEIDDSEPWAHASLGFAQLWGRREYEMGLASLNQAISLNPNNAYFHLWISNAYCLAGHQDEAMEAIQIAMRLHPNHPPIYLHFLARILVTSQRFEEALPYLERLVKAMPTSTNSLATYAACNAGLGRMEMARSAVQDVLRLSPSFSLKTLPEQSPFAMEKDLKTYRSLLRLAGLPE